MIKLTPRSGNYAPKYWNPNQIAAFEVMEGEDEGPVVTVHFVDGSTMPVREMLVDLNAAMARAGY